MKHIFKLAIMHSNMKTIQEVQKALLFKGYTCIIFSYFIIFYIYRIFHVLIVMWYYFYLTSCAFSIPEHWRGNRNYKAGRGGCLGANPENVENIDAKCCILAVHVLSFKNLYVKWHLVWYSKFQHPRRTVKSYDLFSSPT